MLLFISWLFSISIIYLALNIFLHISFGYFWLISIISFVIIWLLIKHKINQSFTKKLTNTLTFDLNNTTGNFKIKIDQIKNIINELCLAYQIKPPKLIVTYQTGQPNCYFLVAKNEQAIVIDKSLIDLLNRAELASAIGCELAHLANHDYQVSLLMSYFTKYITILFIMQCESIPIILFNTTGEHLWGVLIKNKKQKIFISFGIIAAISITIFSLKLLFKSSYIIFLIIAFLGLIITFYLLCIATLLGILLVFALLLGINYLIALLVKNKFFKNRVYQVDLISSHINENTAAMISTLQKLSSYVIPNKQKGIKKAWSNLINNTDNLNFIDYYNNYPSTIDRIKRLKAQTN